jgi:hypothetical protein
MTSSAMRGAVAPTAPIRAPVTRSRHDPDGPGWVHRVGVDTGRECSRPVRVSYRHGDCRIRARAASRCLRRDRPPNTDCWLNTSVEGSSPRPWCRSTVPPL